MAVSWDAGKLKPSNWGINSLNIVVYCANPMTHETTFVSLKLSKFMSFLSTQLQVSVLSVTSHSNRWICKENLSTNPDFLEQVQ